MEPPNWGDILVKLIAIGLAAVAAAKLSEWAAQEAVKLRFPEHPQQWEIGPPR